VFHHPVHRHLVSISLALLGIGLCGAAHAAPLTYSTAETISLSSPATTFTIATGSVADALQVNATNVIVTLSSSTGGSFTLISPSYDLTIASSSVGGALTLSCTSGVASAIISQAAGQTTYTISPAASQCTTPSNNSNGGGGGGSVGVASQFGSPYISGVGIIATSTQTAATSTITTSSPAELQAEINSLLALLNSLIAQAAARGIPVPSGTGAGAPYVFTTNLHFGISGSAVTHLQEFLAENSAIYPEAKVTGYFASLTLQAVERFQKQYGIAKTGSAGYGSVGPLTRAKLNSLIKQGIAP